MKFLCLTAALLVSLPSLAAIEVMEPRAPKMILGWLESTRLAGTDMRLKTKLDPGAKTSSMQGTNIEYFQRDGQTWVRFDFTDTDLDTEREETHRLEGRLMRKVVIKRHGAPNVTRPVVSQQFCLFHQIYNAEFSLTDRNKFNYAILLGRSFLANVALIDSSETFLSRPACEGNTYIQDVL